MSSSLYSQSVNFGSFIEEGVDPRTGQFTSSIVLYESPAKVRNTASLKLSLKFSPLDPEDIGFGKGWSLNLSQYHHVHPRRLVLSTGEQYQVTDTGGDLKINDQKLQSFKLEKSGSDFHIIHKDGQIEVLSNAHGLYSTSVPVRLYAPNGRSLQLTWTAVKGQPRLSKITGDSEDLLEIKYRVPRVEIVHARGAEDPTTFTILKQGGRLREFQLPLDGAPKWRFDYQEFGAITCIDRVQGPTGLVEKLTYKAQGFKVPKGGPYSTLPTVSQHVLDPGNQQPAIRTIYSFSEKNFLGYDGVDQWKVNEDNLYRVRDDYRYTSKVSTDGGRTITNTYNKFHLVLKAVQEQSGKQIETVNTYYAKKDVPLEFQPPQFQLPQSIQTTYRDLANPASSRVEETQYAFDEWGNPTLDIRPDGLKTERVYYPPGGESKNCPADPHGFQRHLKLQTITPPKKRDPAPVRATLHSYLEMRTANDAPTDKMVLAASSQSLEDNVPNYGISWTYVDKPDGRDHGRHLEQISTMLDKFPMVKSWSYEYSEADQMTETVQHKTHDGLQTTEKTNQSMIDGAPMAHTDQTGVKTTFKYDQIGRRTSVTVSPGTSFEATKKFDYSVGGDTGGTTLTTTEVNGLRTRSITDGLGRLCQIEKQDDDGKWNADGSYTGTFRVVEQMAYNELGQCSQKVETDWLRDEDGPKKQTLSHEYKYDDWGSVCQVTSSNGVTTSKIKDPIAQTYTEGIVGQGKKRAQFEPLNTLIQSALLKKDDTLYRHVDYSNDGLGRKVQQTDSLGYVTRYGYDSFDRVKETTWPNKNVIKTQYTGHSADALAQSIQVQDITLGKQDFDGLGRTKTQKVGSRETLLSYKGVSPKPSHITTPKKKQAQIDYEPALGYAVTSLKSDDNPRSYKYDPHTGDMLQSNNPYYSEILEHFPSGHLESENTKLGDNASFSTKYTWSMNGKLQRYSNVHGQNQILEYDEHGRLFKVSQGPLVVTLDYDQANRPWKSSVSDTQKGSDLTTIMTYDDFGRETERKVSQNSKTLYKLVQSYDVLSRLETRELRSGDDAMVRQETFGYDNMSRLADYQCHGKQVPIDEHKRELKRQEYDFTSVGGLDKVTTTFQDGSQNVTHHTYDEGNLGRLVRITNTHPESPKEVILKYDDDGNVTRDEKGRELQYDAMGRFKAVLDGKGTVLSEYRYDSRGRLISQAIPGKPDHYLHYRGGDLVAATHGSEQSNYVHDGLRYWGEILKDGQKTETQLWASDSSHSTVAWLDSNDPSQLHSQSYTPYGFSSTGPDVSWNGQWRDPVTGWYHLGNGYRVYNPALMRFNSPDQWSPFTSGEVNPYAYCRGDPINRGDQNGHASLGWRDLALAIVGIGVGIAVGILTAGAGFAVEAGLGIAAGVAADVVTGMTYDAATGKSPSWKSVGSDALYGAIGGVTGEVGGRLLSKGIKALGRSGSSAMGAAAIRAESRTSRTMGPLGFTFTHGRIINSPEQNWWADMVYFDSINGEKGLEGFLTHGNEQGYLVGRGLNERELFGGTADFVARQTILPAMKAAGKAQPLLRLLRKQGRPFYLFACYGADSGAGQQVANILRRDVIAFEGPLAPLERHIQAHTVYHLLETPGGIEKVYGNVGRRTFTPEIPMEID
ncbi:hypothetical protein FOBRF1_014636 [Fusarium oxysporum]